MEKLIQPCHAAGVLVFSDAIGANERIEAYHQAIAWGIDVIQSEHPLRVMRAVEMLEADARVTAPRRWADGRVVVTTSRRSTSLTAAFPGVRLHNSPFSGDNGDIYRASSSVELRPLTPRDAEYENRVIPPFDESGSLPPGVHPATLAEIEVRFGRQSELRRVQTESVRWMIDLAIRAGVQRIVLNGSFVTDIMEPNDVDCALLLADDYPRDTATSDELIKGLPFLEILRVDEQGFERLAHRFFATDRHGVAKGMIEDLL